jgi:hypothetical protein
MGIASSRNIPKVRGDILKNSRIFHFCCTIENDSAHFGDPLRDEKQLEGRGKKGKGCLVFAEFSH